MLALIATMLLSAGCSDDTLRPPHSGGTMDCVANGTSWAATSANASWAASTLFVQGRRVIAAGDTETIALTLYGVANSGIYGIGTVSGSNINAASFKRGGVNYATAILPSVAGSVEISRLDGDSVVGTFQFVVVRNGDPKSTDTLRTERGHFAIALEH